jgi:hypothetical protein
MAEQCPASAGLFLSNDECSGPLPPPVGSLTYQMIFVPEAHSGTRDATDDCHAVWFGIIGGADESINRPGRNSI